MQARGRSGRNSCSYRGRLSPRARAAGRARRERPRPLFVQRRDRPLASRAKRTMTRLSDRRSAETNDASPPLRHAAERSRPPSRCRSRRCSRCSRCLRRRSRRRIGRRAARARRSKTAARRASCSASRSTGRRKAGKGAGRHRAGGTRPARTRRATAPEPALAPALCEDGTAPCDRAAGAFSCGDGSEPSCANESNPIRSGRSLDCVLAPPATEAACEQEEEAGSFCLTGTTATARRANRCAKTAARPTVRRGLRDLRGRLRTVCEDSSTPVPGSGDCSSARTRSTPPARTSAGRRAPLSRGGALAGAAARSAPGAAGASRRSWRARARRRARRAGSPSGSAAPRPARATLSQTRPTGFSVAAAAGAGDAGDADADDRPPRRRAAPLASASATSAETAPWRSISSAGDPRLRDLDVVRVGDDRAPEVRPRRRADRSGAPRAGRRCTTRRSRS